MPFIYGALNVGPYLRDTLTADKVKTTEDAIMEIYRRLRPVIRRRSRLAIIVLQNLFFTPARYGLVGCRSL